MPVGYKIVTHSYHSIVANGQYRMYYPIGQTISAPPNTLGLMVDEIPIIKTNN